MSLLTSLEQAIKACKDEQAKINCSIQLYREILHALTPQERMDTKESQCSDDAATEINTSPGEKEDMELLERALEEALRVRSGTGSSNKDCDRNKQSASQRDPAVTSKGGTQASAASKGNHSTTRSTSKPDRKIKPGTPVSSTQGSKSPASYNPGESKTGSDRNMKSQSHSKNKIVRSSGPSGSDAGKAAAISTPRSHDTATVSHEEESRSHSSPQQNRTAAEEIAKWKSLWDKQNRLWDKVVALQRKPVPGRSHFMERMRATFPTDWPCGSPDQTRALLSRLTHQGHDLTQDRQTKELLAKHTAEAGTELGGQGSKHGCYLTQMTAAELKKSAEQAKREWEAWDRWRPEGGCLCPSGAFGAWRDGIIAPLPLTVTYTTEAELRQMENLRMRVALLQQEIHLQQALLDALSPHLSSIVHGCPSPSMLRDIYSLLGEGGERFPALVLDSEPDCPQSKFH